MAKISVTKLDAARRQIKTAIRLWFQDEDPVSIHLLAYSSHEIVHRLYRAAGHSDLLFDAKVVPEQHRDAYCLGLKAAANFFKHARQGKEDDPTKTIDFNPDLNELFLFLSAIGLRKIGEPATFEDFAFFSYIAIQNQGGWIPDQLLKQHFPPNALDAISDLRTVGKKDFLRAWKEGLDRMGQTFPMPA